MSFFVSATPAEPPKTNNSRLVGIFLAGVYVVMAVAQLFTFEDFPALIEDFSLPLDERGVVFLAAALVTFEIFAIPFLLGMALSPLMRVVSMILGWLVAGIWTVLSVWICTISTAAMSAGFLGETIDLPVGWWAVFFSLSLAVLASWASWGRWPQLTLKK